MAEEVKQQEPMMQMVITIGKHRIEFNNVPVTTLTDNEILCFDPNDRPYLQIDSYNVLFGEETVTAG